MHRHDAGAAALADAVVRYALDRIRLDPPPLDGPLGPGELRALASGTITPGGIGGEEALRIFSEVLAPACISVDHPRHLSFVPGAPTEAAVLFDLVVGASNVYAGSWLEGAGAIFAENETLSWLAGLAGLPEAAGGTFVAGGTAGNLSALIAARWRWRYRAGGRHDRHRGLMLAAAGAHSSVVQAARVMDADVVMVPAVSAGRMVGEALSAALDGLEATDRERVFVVVATGGTTNAGIIDDLAGIAAVCGRHDIWLHVDAAYGGAGLLAPSVRSKFDGIELVDSFIVDPHKWLFAPYDSCALIYRDPEIARSAHTQRAEYLEVLHSEDPANEPWNASDYAHHLSRRARGLPLWFSVATHGTDAYVAAVEATLETAHAGARLIEQAAHTELLLEPELSVVLFRRNGWTTADYQRWSDEQLDTQQSFVVPTSWAGEPAARFCVVNPLTTVDDLQMIVDSMA